MGKEKQLLGAQGEKLAVHFLRRQGYQIISRNFSCCFGEIDIIARQAKVTVFIEVKARTSTEFGLPQEAIGHEKIKHLHRSAQFYLNNCAHPEGNFRFDVVAVILGPPCQIQLIQDAF